jgi:hypothetical protein
MRAVSRTTIHKVGTINRCLGYQLCLERRRSLPAPVRRAQAVALAGWEEMMNAWRIVHGSLFATMCTQTEGLGMGNYRREFAPGRNPSRAASEFWFHTPSLVEHVAIRGRTGRHVEFHAGNYARPILNLLHVAMFGCLSPLALIIVEGCRQPRFDVVVVGLVLFAASLAAVIYSRKLDRVRLDQLENGVLSIYSSAVIWEATAAAHYGAREASDAWLIDYIERLADESAALASQPWSVPRWTAERWESLVGRDPDWPVDEQTGRHFSLPSTRRVVGR